MKLYPLWKNLCDQNSQEPKRTAFWQGYYAAEAEGYKVILAEKCFAFSGTAEMLAEKLRLEAALIPGFLDGINTSLEKAFTAEELEGLETETNITLQILPEKLYYNMLNARAKWLYTLPEWEGILAEEDIRRITRQWREDNIAKSVKISRNDPCPCGSGQKYKYCCGE